MEGFSVPVHRSLTQPILLGGAPREFAILNGTLAAALFFGLHTLLLGSMCPLPFVFKKHRPWEVAGVHPL